MCNRILMRFLLLTSSPLLPNRYANKSLLEHYALSPWWREGMKRVKVHKDRR